MSELGALTVLDLVEVQHLAEDAFRCVPSTGNSTRLGGSELMVASLLAASATTSGALPPAAVHASFLRSGRSDTPVEVMVTRLQDGRSSAVRAVTATQDGVPIMAATFRFFAARPADDWQRETVFDLTADEGEEQFAVVATLPTLRHFEVRAAVRPTDGKRVIHPYWVKSKAELPDDPLLHAALVLYLTDLGTTGSARAPGTPMRERMGPMSLDHAFWWHRPVRVDEWVHVNATSLTEASGRALARGEVVSANGVLAASFSQDVVVPAQTPERRTQ